MKSSRRSVVPILALGLGLGLIAACNSLIGAGVPNQVSGFAGTGSDASSQCLHASDCPDSQVCLFRVCSAPCVADKDCQSGARCLQTAAGTACVDATAASCSSENVCPDGSACTAGVCRDSCSDNSKCLADQSCIAGACIGNDEPSGGGSSAGGASGGSAGDNGGDSGAGGSTGGSSGGSTGGTAGAGGAMPVGPDTGLAKSGEPCAVPGDVACADHASTLRFICKGGIWAVSTPCDTGELCDSASTPFGQCQKVAPDCIGHNAGDSFCNSQTRIKCGADLITEDQTKCDSAALCLAGTGAACAACTSDQHQCTGNVLQRCKDDGTSFETETTCSDPAQPCNALAGACTSLACLTAGALSCVGDTLEKCNAARTALDVVQVCGAGPCNSTLLNCDACSPSSSSCKDTANASSCSPDGQTLSTNKCPTATPHCVGNGQCVQCLATTDCPAAPDCYSSSCSGAGSCTQAPLGVNAACGGGTQVCTAAHTCVQCNTIAQCPTPATCYAATCNGNVCGTMPLASGTCPAGFCDGNGACVQCVNDGNCTGANSLCRGGTCVNPSELIGFASEPSSATLITGYLYLLKLPYASHASTLDDFAIVTTATAAASVKLGLYAADTNGLPTGTAIAYTKTAVSVGLGKIGQIPGIPGQTLAAGQYYLAVSTNTASTIAIQGNSTSAAAGYKVADTWNSTPSAWPNLAGDAFVGYFSELAVFVDVTDTN